MDSIIDFANKYIKYATDLVVMHSPGVIGAIVTLVIGLWVIKRITNIFESRLRKSNLDDTLVPFIRDIANGVLKVLLVISVAGMVGIQTTSFVAVLGAAGLAVGLALQGSLANFAGGVLILIFRPFRIGSYIKAQGQEGTVEEISLFVTKLLTIDNKVVFIPNGPLAGGVIENLNHEDTRRVDMVFGIGYGDDIDKARQAIKQTLEGIPEVMSNPAPDIIVTELADSSVNFSVRPWCKSADYWTVYAKAHESIKKTFDQAGISIPFPQRDVHLFQEK